MTAVLERETAIYSRLSQKRHEFEVVNVADLRVDSRVQQPLREGKVAEMLKRGYDFALANVIVISHRENGDKVILDGQHRAQVAYRSGVSTIEAKVWYGLALAEEAWLFKYLNKKSNPTAVSLFKAGVVDRETVPRAIADIIGERGWKISDSKSGDGNFAAVGIAERIYEGQGMFRTTRPGSQIFARTIETITDAWGLDKNGSDGQIIGGVAVFLIRYWDKLDQQKLISALSRMTPRALGAQARDFKNAAHVNVTLAHGYKVHQEYNKRTRTKLTAFAL